MKKNVAGQKVVVFAWDVANSAWEAGDAANITALVSKDGAAGVASNDVNPTEITNLDGGYAFDVTQDETNCDLFILQPASVTADILIQPISIYTRDE